MGYMEEFKFWLEDDYFDADTKAELAAISGDEKEKDYFNYFNIGLLCLLYKKGR